MEEYQGSADIKLYEQLKGASNMTIEYDRHLDKILYDRHRLAIMLLSSHIPEEDKPTIKKAFDIYNDRIKRLLYL